MDSDASGSGHAAHQDRKSTRLNSSHVAISYAVFCLKKKKLELAERITSNKPLTNFAVLQALPMISESNPQTGLLMESLIVFFFNDTATTEIYTLSLHDALPISHFVTLWHEVFKDRVLPVVEIRPSE